METPEKLLKPYNPNETESEIYGRWEESGYFNPDNLPASSKLEAESFSIVLPPPNVTGTLHIGHAVMLAVEDIMVRFARMQGKKTLWLPGTDHAAIATQSKVEAEIYKKENKRRHDLGREELIRRVEAFAQESHDTIISQLKRMGSSLDWSREAFTLDEKRKVAVNEAFKRMFDAGLIYRGNRVVNWDPKGQTTVSDDEVEHVPQKGTLYTFRYDKNFPIAISTTRPETKVGDTAVAVHPADSRYQQYIGQTYVVKFAGKKFAVKIIADAAVDPAFGTGALGVTPAHSQVDFEMRERHDLPLVQVIDELAKMTAEAGPLVAGKKTKEAREIIVNWLRENNLLEKEEEIEMNVTVAERTGGIIEPLPKLQWFVDVNKKIPERGNKTLKELMRDAVERDGIKILPDRFEKIYFHWIDNLRDWCISRQIWYGHRIPVWYRGKEIKISNVSPGDGWTQDEDTLDTWFSSGLWTFSTLGWPFDYAQGKPKPGSDLANYHPTTVLETGYDILFFWVARMILMSKFLLDDIPFKTVYLHGLVRDAKGQKMSKSLGNIIDPVDMIEKFGADAVRMSLIIGTSPGNDSKMSEDKIKAYKLFANKLWNITRFITQVEGGRLEPGEITEADKKYLEEFDALIAEITKEMEEYKFYLVGEKLYHYVWHTFADKILEESKSILQGSRTDAEQTQIDAENPAAISRAWLLRHILDTSLKLLHPFMPFITEEIWTLVHNPEKEPSKMLIIQKWPR